MKLNGLNNGLISGCRSNTSYYNQRLHPYAKQYIDRMLVKPPIGLQLLIDKTIRDLVFYNIWDELDQFVFMNLHTQQASTLDIKGKYDHVHVGSPTWIEKTGVETNGNSSYVNTKFIPFAEGKYVLANAGIYFNIYTTLSGVGFDGAITAGAVGVGIGYDSYNALVRFNSSSYTSYTWALGYNSLARIGTNTYYMISGTENTKSLANEGLLSLEFYLGRFNYAAPYYHIRRYKQYGFGSAMNASKRALLRDIINNFNSKIATAY